MKRFFSGSKNEKSDSRSSSLSSNARSLFGSNKTNTNEEPNRAFSPKTRSRATSFGRRLLSSDSSPTIPQFATDSQQQLSSDNIPELSPILAPIVTLLSAQAHRRYHKGPILLLHDLKNDGTPADRVWKEYFAIILGTQVALWDAKELAISQQGQNNNNNSKPKYINFADATLRPLDSDDDSIIHSNDQSDCENILVLSTTLQNRYLFKFNDFKSYNEWTAAIRLSLYEHVSLQEAYTGAFLSSRGSKLGDIKNILASNNKFTYSEWVSVRFGPGMPWKRCFAVVTQYNKKISEKDKKKYNSNMKKKKKKKNNNSNTNNFLKRMNKNNDDDEDDDDDDIIEEETENHFNENNNDFTHPTSTDQSYNGTIIFYENDKKINKKYATAIVTDATALYAVYPSSPLLIDNSTILKLDGYVSMGQDNKIQNSSIFIMAEKHLGVPSYDTIIRFMVPAMNAFNLYGRPKQLIANRNDPNSLMFALPTLPCVHYLPVNDILEMINNNETSPWNNEDWNYHIDQLLQLKIKEDNYTGCGFKPKSQTIYSSPKVKPEELFKSNELTSSSSFVSQVAEGDNIFSSPTRSINNNRLSSPTRYNNNNNNNMLYPTDMSLVENADPNKNGSAMSSQESIQRRSILGSQDSQHSVEQFTNISPYRKQGEFTSLSPDRVNLGYSNNNQSPVKSLPYPPVLVNNDEEMSTPPSFTKLHSVSPTKSEGYESPYEEYVGIDSQKKPFEISAINEPEDYNDDENFTSARSFRKESENEHLSDYDDDDIPMKRTEDFDMDANYTDLIDKINDININNSSSSFEKNSGIKQKIVPEGDIDPDIASGLYLNTHLPFDKKINSGVSNNQSPGKQAVEADVFDPDYVEQYQINESENIFSGQDSNLSNGHTIKNPVRSPEKNTSLPISASNMNIHQHAGMNSNRPLPSMQNSLQPQYQPQHAGQQRFANESMPHNNTSMASNVFNGAFAGPNHTSRLQGGYPQGRQNQQQQQYQRQMYQGLPPLQQQNQQQQNQQQQNQQQQYQRQVYQALPPPQQQNQQQFMNRGPYNKPAMGGRIPPPNPVPNNKGFTQFMPNTPTKNPYANN
ncbi:protein Skg3p [Monosporozyma servazzii]